MISWIEVFFTILTADRQNLFLSRAHLKRNGLNHRALAKATVQSSKSGTLATTAFRRSHQGARKSFAVSFGPLTHTAYGTMADDRMISPAGPTDPRLPLNAMQVFKLKKSWKGIKRSLDDTGVEMLIRLFQLKPNLQNLFSKLKGKSLDELRVDEEMEKQGGKIMGVVDECVQNIDNVDNTLELLAMTATKHQSYPGFKSSMYMEMETPLLDAVKITLGDRYTDNMDSIYKIAFHYLLDTLRKNHKDKS